MVNLYKAVFYSAKVRSSKMTVYIFPMDHESIMFEFQIRSGHLRNEYYSLVYIRVSAVLMLSIVL